MIQNIEINEIEISSPKITKVKQMRRRLKSLKMKNFCLVNPQKILEEKYYYKIRDIYICDHVSTNELKSLIGGLKYIKKVVSLINDKECSLVIGNLLDNVEGFPPIKLLIYRLRTLGNADAHNLSKTLKKVMKIVKKEKRKVKKREDLDKIYSKKSYQDYLENTRKIIKEFADEHPIIFWRDSNFESQSDYQLIQMGYNYKLIQILGQDPINFGINLLKKGLPDLVWLKQEYFEMIDEILKSVFFPKKGVEEGMPLPEFYFKTHTSLMKTTSKYQISKFEEDGYIELSVVEVFYFENSINFKLARQDSFTLAAEKKKDELELNLINDKGNKNLLIHDDESRPETVEWIKKFYPNFNIKILQKEQTEESLRCSYRSVK